MDNKILKTSLLTLAVGLCSHTLTGTAVADGCKNQKPQVNCQASFPTENECKQLKEYTIQTMDMHKNTVLKECKSRPCVWGGMLMKSCKIGDIHRPK